MAKGDPQLSPWTCEFSDYLGRKITITVNFNNASRALLNNNLVHRDAGCLWTHIVWGDPNGANAKPTPAVPTGDTTFSAAQIQSFTGFTTIDQVLAAQVTAAP